ncbi:hypothetical protein PVAP13_6KG054392 [Panicum virgatum]|uniref:Uncharacterized protein n=1 Tax=Panicum virgatum TaxID=38727 RepID=A0A8T0R864_PANVG|nr:hypothetical protein PVAP13_6KG054392 [Panicum virgatum]
MLTSRRRTTSAGVVFSSPAASCLLVDVSGCCLSARRRLLLDDGEVQRVGVACGLYSAARCKCNLRQRGYSVRLGVYVATCLWLALQIIVRLSSSQGSRWIYIGRGGGLLTLRQVKSKEFKLTLSLYQTTRVQHLMWFPCCTRTHLFEPIKILSPTCLLALSPNYMIRIATMKLTSSWFPVNLEHIWKIIGGPS